MDDGYRVRYQELEEAVRQTGNERDTAMRGLVDALRDLRASRPATVTRNAPRTETPDTSRTSRDAPASRGPSLDHVDTDSAPTTTATPHDDGHHDPTDFTLPPDVDLYDATPRPTPPGTPVGAPVSRATPVDEDTNPAPPTPTQETDPAQNDPTAKGTRTPRTSGGRARGSSAHGTATSPVPAHALDQRGSDGIPGFPDHTDPAADRDHPHDQAIPPPHPRGVPTTTAGGPETPDTEHPSVHDGGETETVPAAEEPEAAGEGGPSRQEELNAEFHGALNVAPNS